MKQKYQHKYDLYVTYTYTYTQARNLLHNLRIRIKGTLREVPSNFVPSIYFAMVDSSHGHLIFVLHEPHMKSNLIIINVGECGQAADGSHTCNRVSANGSPFCRGVTHLRMEGARSAAPSAADGSNPPTHDGLQQIQSY